MMKLKKHVFIHFHFLPSKMYTWLLRLRNVKTGDSKFSLSEMKSFLSLLPHETLMQ